MTDQRAPDPAGYCPPGEPLQARWDPLPEDLPEPDVAKPGRLRRFVATYGWRAYALPVLSVITVLVVVDAVRGVDQPGAAAAPAVGRLSGHADKAGIIGAPPKGDGSFAGRLSGSLPAGGPYTESGAGTWHLVPGVTPQVGAAQTHLFTYTLEVENGVDTSDIGGDESVATMVEATLANPKSWIHDPRFGFQRIAGGTPDFRISLASRQTTRQLCGFEIPIDSSCYNSDDGRVVLSDVRWVRGAVAFDGDVGSYRQYQINHEVGHAIGYHDHQPCGSDGGLAPVMMQQTFGVANDDIAALDPEGVVPMDGKKCRFNPWPYPRN
ncbi:DUF3152 domain-containing protein [Nocardia sp. alder85J]|uniref:DUF3152 domain-containing protein n=1 Tax=Nocardia sp. alder85J TaxID=2862949 RepID=UPI001CD46598|nr:DUF3152 domain-containing protein [Nocardia sp. alder85J]MCX4092246.1 DUF3152 domain-containing protein [Nocardia sp. alder85J]